MNNTIIYLIKSGIAISCFYLVYYLFLRKTTFFKQNRIFLLTGLLISIIFPFIEIELLITSPSHHVIPTFYIDLNSPADKGTNITSVSENKISSTINYSQIIFGVIILGSLFFLSRLIWQTLRILRLKRNYQVTYKAKHPIYFINENYSPFSWFGYIFINKNGFQQNELDKIIDHEIVHIEQFHFLDLLIVELLTVLQWFNPFVWLFQKGIKEVHEYLADDEIIKQGHGRPQYQALLVNQTIGIDAFSLSNSFNHSLIKKRIHMMTKMKTSKWAKIRILAAVPLIVFLLFAFSKPKIQPILKEVVISGIVINGHTKEPKPGVSIIISGTTIGTMSDREGKFTLKTSNSDVELVFSFVGFKTQKIKVKDKKEIIVSLEEGVFQVDLNNKTAIKEDNKENSNSNYSSINQKNPVEVFVVVEEMPVYKGGNQAILDYLKKNLKIQNGENGNVLVSFYVENDGKVSNVSIEKGINPSKDIDIKKIILDMPDWSPGKQRGVPVRCKVGLNVPLN
jgi:hypothetical protein